MTETTEKTARDEVKIRQMIAEDGGLSGNTIKDRYSKLEIAEKYLSLLDECDKMLKKDRRLEKEFERLRNKYEKTYKNLEIFGSPETIGEFTKNNKSFVL